MSRSSRVTTPADAYLLLRDRIANGDFEDQERDGLFAALETIRPIDRLLDDECVGSVVSMTTSACIQHGACQLANLGWSSLSRYTARVREEERHDARERLEEAVDSAVGKVVVGRFSVDHFDQVQEKGVLSTILPACSVCYEVESPLHLDHVVPKSKGGLDRFANYQLLCAPCNTSKRDKTMSEWIQWVNESDAPGADKIRQRRDANADRVWEFLS